MTIAIYSPSLYGSGQPGAGNVLQTITTILPDSNALVYIYVANSSSTTTETVRIAVVPNNQTIDVQHYLAYDTPIDPNQLFVLANIGLDSSDRIIVSSANGLATFNVSGNKFTEIPY